ncbi:MAG: DDE-type integrase/transposase/recombinase, partial [Candidatus Thiodiazotropha endolucinida]|nr:DDE-type integrase/transposase/recombinase [Candidatus Thiodiazotropha taylori]MCW4264513.1 DDE-type integrase/transposase/recombinase [Candidatus Thiodiazotropha endolucinida]
QALMEIKLGLESGNLPVSLQKKPIILENILYYISDVDSDPVLRLYIPVHLQPAVIQQYHDSNGHMGADKTFDAIRSKYYWPNLYKELCEYIARCITCQCRSIKKQIAPIQESDIPPFPFAKVSMDLSGPYPTTMSGNRYIVAFVDWYSGFPEAFAVPDKTADTIAHLIINKMFNRYGTIVTLVTDNGSECNNKTVRETLEALNIKHVKTSIYHPQSNAKVERWHKTLHDVLSKVIQGQTQIWDQFLPSVLGSLRFHVNESTKFSPFFLLYNREVLLPIDNILKPKRRFEGEDLHKIALQQQHKSFVLVHRNLKRAKKRQAKYANRNTHEVQLEIGDPVYYKVHKRPSKLHNNWTPYYRIIDKTTPVNFKIKNQLDGSVISCHANDIFKAHVDEWKIPKESSSKRPLRKARYVVPPSSDDSSNYDADSEEIPLARLAKRFRNVRKNADSEGFIPKMELAKHQKYHAKWPRSSSVHSSASESRADSTDATESYDYQLPENQSMVTE